jgi:molybdopterin-synthase adenylyltransferase
MEKTLTADMADIISSIKKAAIKNTMPDDVHYTCISTEHVANVARHFKVNGRDIEIAALEQHIVPDRYVRNMKTLSPKDQITLLKSRVCVVGLGGLGGVLVEILARIGIGNLNLIDGDTFEDSNLNRQFLSSHALLKTNKTKAAEKRINEINPSIAVQCHFEYLNESNAERLVKNSHVVVDCLDNIPSRFLLEKTSKKIGVPLVSAAVAGVSGHLTSIFPEDKGLRLIYGNAETLTQKGAEVSLGTLPQAVTLIAATEASEVIKIILGKGLLLRNKLFVVDLMDNTLDVLSLT